ncbi:hypothetical protein ACQP2X_27750 [Actinoplanes sp. CA-131856]
MAGRLPAGQHPLAVERCDALAERRLHWQRPGGGGNCDKNPAADGLGLLESRRVDGGWPAPARFFTTASPDAVDWGGVSARRPNPWVTADALAVLEAAKR